MRKHAQLVECEPLLSDDEAYERARANPATKARMDELARRIRRKEGTSGPGIGAEELPDFLREHG